MSDTVPAGPFPALGGLLYLFRSHPVTFATLCQEDRWVESMSFAAWLVAGICRPGAERMLEQVRASRRLFAISECRSDSAAGGHPVSR